MFRKGFTLIELLVVVAVLALLASIVFSNLGGAREGARISNALSFQSQTHSLLGSDLVGWWNFNEGDARDISGYGNNGTIYGGATYATDTPSNEGHSLSLNGSNQYVGTSMTSNTYFQNGFTISAWIKPGQIGTVKGIISKTESTTGQNGFVLIQSGSLPQQVRLMLNESSWINSAIFLSQNTWHHIIIVMESGSPNALVTFHVNGDISGTARQNIGRPLSDITTNNALDIGRRATSQYFNGFIDDVRIYSRALSASEIQTLYAQTKDRYLANE